MADNSQAPILIDAKAAAALLSLSPRHFYRLVNSGHAPAPLRLGRSVRWPRQAIEGWIADGCKPVRPPCAARTRRRLTARNCQTTMPACPASANNSGKPSTNAGLPATELPKKPESTPAFSAAS